MAERKYQFERLTPIDNMDLDVYEDAIDYVFDNPDVKNVAISGAYSAGKSSVLKSYAAFAQRPSMIFTIFYCTRLNLQPIWESRSGSI